MIVTVELLIIVLGPQAYIRPAPGKLEHAVYVCSIVSNSSHPKDCSLQAPLSMGSPKQEYWSGLPFPSLGHLPVPGMELVPLVSPVLAGGFFTTVPLGWF